MGIESPVHILFIAAVALIVLGPKRLPELARALGQGLREFRGSLEDGAAEPQPAQQPSPPPSAAAQPSPPPPSPPQPGATEPATAAATGAVVPSEAAATQPATAAAAGAVVPPEAAATQLVPQGPPPEPGERSAEPAES